MADFEPGTRLDELMARSYRRTFGSYQLSRQNVAKNPVAKWICCATQA
jgi:hypothetical protein